MKKIRKTLGVAALLVASAFALNAQVQTDAQRAEGIASGALADCISDARAAGNDILVTSFPGNGEGNWAVRFCSQRRDINSPAQRVGTVILENWQVVETTCEFPAPTSNPC